MISELRKKIDTGLAEFLRRINKQYGLSSISPLLVKSMSGFALRKGKRVRPILFVLGYLGFSKKKNTAGLLTSAVSIELLHDFMLVHDDIIDKSDTRRGKPSMHKMLNNYLARGKNIKFSGQDLSIVAGDVLYALGIEAFLAINEEKDRKEKALRQLIKAALYTGCGEFAELLYGMKPLDKIKKEDIYKIYDYKTAYYTFSSPLAIGAILGGASEGEIKKLLKYGIFLGRAFQIKDDILGLFFEEKKIGKSALSDLQESKKTLLVWYAYNNSKGKDRSSIKAALSKEKVTQKDLLKMRELVARSGALDYAKAQIEECKKKAAGLIASSRLSKSYKELISKYTEEILE